MRKRAYWMGGSAMPGVMGVVCAVLALACSPVCLASNLNYVPNEYIVRVQHGTDVDKVEQAVARLGATVVKSIPVADSYLIRLGKSPVMGRATGGHAGSAQSFQWVIESIEPNAIGRKASTPNDEHWGHMWNMRLINAPRAWDLEKGASSVVVAVVDTGVSRHPDLVDRLLPGYDFVDDDADPNNDVDGHGTHVSGTIAAQGNNSIGVVGVCWDGVKILPVRVLGDDGSGTLDWFLSGLDYILQQYVQYPNMAVNMSMGWPGSFDSPIMQAKLAELAQAGIVLVAAAGNDGDMPDPRVGAPAKYNECIAVASVGPYEEIAPYSSYGPADEVDIAAPGGDGSVGPDGWVWSTTITWTGNPPAPSYGYGGTNWQGTSMASPCVAGAAALLLSYGVPWDEVRGRLINSARYPKAGYDSIKFGAGILDLQAALANASLKITQPKKGATLGTNPEFRISFQGIATNSLKVYVDYADLNDDGIPDDPDENVVIDGTNVNYYIDNTHSAVSFKWSDFSQTQMSAGRHSIYATATSAAGGADVSDWASFSVARKLIPKGIHLFSFPYALTNRATNTPSLVLPDVNFGFGNMARASLIRWIAAPRSLTDSSAIGYETYSPNNAADRVWTNPIYSLSGTSLPTGGGYAFYRDPLDFLNPAQQNFAFPAGAGFWLVLPTDAYIEESWADTSRGPLEGLIGFDGSKGFSIRLYKGWNMIGNPYLSAIPWRAALFTYRGQTKTLADAEAAGWVRSAMYGYGGPSTGYVRVSDRDMLEPYTGYWLLANIGGPNQGDALTVNLLP